MVMMCPAETFRTVCDDYPETKNWMVYRSLVRRNYLLQTQRTIYLKYNVESIFKGNGVGQQQRRQSIIGTNFRRFGTNLRRTQTEHDILASQVYRRMSQTRGTLNHMGNPYDQKVRE